MTWKYQSTVIDDCKFENTTCMGIQLTKVEIPIEEFQDIQKEI